MKPHLRLLAVAIALLLPGAVLARWAATADATAALGPHWTLPARVGPWVAAEEARLDADAFAIVQPDAYVYRAYHAPGRTPIWLYVALYLGRASYGKGAHDPHVCYPAQGWEILESRPVALAVGGPAELHATRVHVHKNVREESVLYWFQPAGRWPRGAAVEQLLRVVDAVAGRPQYAFVRLSGPFDPSGDSWRDLGEFAAAVAPAIRGGVSDASARRGP